MQAVLTALLGALDPRRWRRGASAMAGMASRLFGRGGGQKGEIPRSPFGQRRCVLALPAEALGGGGGLGMAVDGDLVVQQITDAAGPAAAAEVPVGWRIVGVDDRPVSSAVQLTAAIELATPTSPWQPISAPEIEAFSLYN